MKIIGSFGHDALAIANMLTGRNLPCKQVSARDISDTARCPQVLLISAPDALQAKTEVEILRGQGYIGQMIIMSSMFLTDEELVMLYLAGADNIVSGEASNELLFATVYAAAQKRVPKEERCLTLGNLTVDTVTHLVTTNNSPVKFSPSEYELLILFLRRKGKVLSREKILELLRPQNHYDLDTRLIDVLVAKTRKILVKARSEGFSLTTVRSYGYRLDTD